MAAAKVSGARLERGVPVGAAVAKERTISLTTCSRCPDGCVTHKLEEPFIIATAQHVIAPQIAIPIEDDVLCGDSLEFGQDAIHSERRAHPGGFSVGTTPAELASRMRSLVHAFAPADPDGKASRLVEAFLSKRSKVDVFTDPGLDRAVAQHENFRDFSDRVVAAPGTPPRAGTTRIHQALAANGWDIDRVHTITDLGPPAWNKGSKELGTGDYRTGLGLMMNGVQHVLVIAEDYTYSSCDRLYSMKLKFVMYDVFGLDDGDLTDPAVLSVAGVELARTTVGARDNSGWAEQQGITAWWQLQHQHDYAPLVARAVVERDFVVSTEEA